MKKLIAFVAVCTFAIAIVSCGEKKAETTDTTADSVVAEPAPAPVDTTTTTDTTAVQN